MGLINDSKEKFSYYERSSGFNVLEDVEWNSRAISENCRHGNNGV